MVTRELVQIPISIAVEPICHGAQESKLGFHLMYTRAQNTHFILTCRMVVRISVSVPIATLLHRTVVCKRIGQWVAVERHHQIKCIQVVGDQRR